MAEGVGTDWTNMLFGKKMSQCGHTEKGELGDAGVVEKVAKYFSKVDRGGVTTVAHNEVKNEGAKAESLKGKVVILSPVPRQ